MKKPTFDITITPDGTVHVKVHGVSGERCIQLTDMLKEIVGIEKSRVLTDEYRAGHVQIQQQTQVRGRTS